MVCYNPLYAYQLGYNHDTGKPIIHIIGSLSSYGKHLRLEQARKLAGRQDVMQLPCGQCIGCRLKKADEWGLRCMHEAKFHRQNCFVTLTYNDEHLPSDGSVSLDDITKFFKRLRKALTGVKIRYFYSAEYGDKLFRPHYHIIIFGWFPDDVRLFKISDKSLNDGGYKLFRSPFLEKVWGKGFITVGAVNFESARYTAKYSLKKLSEERLRLYKTYNLTPEFNHSSTRGGIGIDFFNKYQESIYNHDYCVVNGIKKPVPRYYDKLLEASNPVRFFEISEARKERACNLKDFEPDRLLVKEALARHRQERFNRMLDAIE